jgi:hypothetical protein
VFEDEGTRTNQDVGVWLEEVGCNNWKAVGSAREWIIGNGDFAILSHVFRLTSFIDETSTGSRYLYSQKEKKDQFETALFHKGESGDLHSSSDLLQSGLALRAASMVINPPISITHQFAQTNLSCHRQKLV